jgi:hypothetical protein
MQLDLYGRLEGGPISINFIFGMRGAARDRDSPLASRMVSREHYIMYKPDAEGPYVRAGRFFAPFGLRLVEHPTYVRRYLDLNTLEETYGASAGYLSDDWEVHATGFVPDFIRPVGHAGKGGAGFGEKRLFDGAAALGLQTRFSFSDESARYTNGFFAKYYLEAAKLLFMGELDFVRQTFEHAPAGNRTQMVSYAGLTYFPTQGMMTGVAWERFDQDLSVKDVARDAFDVQIHIFPWAHFEALLFGRIQTLGGGDGGDTAKTVMLQLHYYL